MKDKRFKPLNTEDEIKRLGARLRELRIKAGYTSAETFAYEHGLSRALYGRYERGKDLRFSTLVKLANCFQISLSELLDNDQK